MSGFIKGGGERITTTRAFADVQASFTILPDVIRAEMARELKALEPRLLARERIEVPHRSGARPAKFSAGRKGLRPAGGLVSLLSTEFDDANLRLSSGLLTPAARTSGFYGYILDAGRGLLKTRSRIGTRVVKGAEQGRYGTVSRRSKPYTRAISPILPGRYDITFGRVRYWARDQVGPVLLKVYDRALVAWLFGR